MINLIAQNTGVWWNVSAEKLGLWFAVGTVAIIGAFKIVDLTVDKYFGTKKRILDRQFEIEKEQAKQRAKIKALSVVSPVSSVAATPEAVATVEAAAQTPTIDVDPKDK